MIVKLIYLVQKFKCYKEITPGLDKITNKKSGPKWNKGRDSRLKSPNWRITFERWRYSFRVMVNRWDLIYKVLEIKQIHLVWVFLAN